MVPGSASERFLGSASYPICASWREDRRRYALLEQLWRPLWQGVFVAAPGTKKQLQATKMGPGITLEGFLGGLGGPF